MNKLDLTKILQTALSEPIKGMRQFHIIPFQTIIEQLGTTDLTQLEDLAKTTNLFQPKFILGYAENREYYGQQFGKHWGIDIIEPEGTPVYSVNDGLVEHVEIIDDTTPDFLSQTFGNCIVTSHKYADEKLLFIYAHLSNLKGTLKKGDQLQKDQQIATLGKSFTKENGGWPAHLHFQIAFSHLGCFAYGGDDIEPHTINPEEVYNIKKF